MGAEMPKPGQTYKFKLDYLGNVVGITNVSADYGVAFMNNVKTYEDDIGNVVLFAVQFHIQLRSQRRTAAAGRCLCGSFAGLGVRSRFRCGGNCRSLFLSHNKTFFLDSEHSGA